MGYKQNYKHNMIAKHNDTQDKHDWLLKQIYHKPHLANVTEPLLYKSMEFALMKGIYTYVTPDISLQSKHTHYLIEVKGTPSPQSKEKYYVQRRKMQEWYCFNDLEVPNIRLVYANTKNFTKNKKCLEDLLVIELS